ncbi:MAG: molybdopterin molybdenumtransferase MoeA, partial [Pseudomonadota bacterium]
AVRPGKPVWSAVREGAPRIVGLPGNPASALVTSRLFLVPLIARMLGQDDTRTYTPFAARLGVSVEANGFRESYLRARMTVGPSGELVVRPAESQDSSRMTPFVEGAVLVHRGPHAPAEEAGAEVQALAMQPDALRPDARSAA